MAAPDPAREGGRGRSPGWWAGGRAVCLTGPGEQVRWAVLPQRSGLRCAPGGTSRPVCPARCQGAVGELQPWLTVPRPAGVTGRWEGQAGVAQLSHSLGAGAGTWEGSGATSSPFSPCPERPQRCLPIVGILLVLPPYNSSQRRDCGPSGEAEGLRADPQGLRRAGTQISPIAELPAPCFRGPRN